MDYHTAGMKFMPLKINECRIEHKMMHGVRKFNIYDTSVQPKVLKGTVHVRDTHNETAEQAAKRRGAQVVGHENFEHEEIKDTLPDKVASFMDRMADFLR